VFHVKHEGSTEPDLPPDRVALLERYRALLEGLAVPRGAIASADLPHLWERHILDSLRGAPHVPATARTVVDLGSGAGLPGIPVAIARPDLEVVLAETRRTRAALLELVVDDLELRNASIFVGRVEELTPAFDVCLARGFASPASTWLAAERLLAPNGVLLYWAGATFDAVASPPGAVVALAEEVPLESGGPIVIMTRQ
jgi:16S rRNA (guanine527-N7)-methyltransferase